MITKLERLDNTLIILMSFKFVITVIKIWICTYVHCIYRKYIVILYNYIHKLYLLINNPIYILTIHVFLSVMQ